MSASFLGDVGELFSKKKPFPGSLRFKGRGQQGGRYPGFYTHRINVLQDLTKSSRSFSRRHQDIANPIQTIKNLLESRDLDDSAAIRAWTTRNASQEELDGILNQLLKGERKKFRDQWSTSYTQATVDDGKVFVRIFDSFSTVLTPLRLKWEKHEFQMLMHAFDWEGVNLPAGGGNPDDFTQQVIRFGEATTASNLPSQQAVDSAEKLHKALDNATKEVLSLSWLKYSISKDCRKDSKLMDLGRAPTIWIRLPRKAPLHMIIHNLAHDHALSLDQLHVYNKESQTFKSHSLAPLSCKATSWEEVPLGNYGKYIKDILKDHGEADILNQLYIVDKSTPFSIIVLTEMQEGSDIGKLIELPRNGGIILNLAENFLQDEYHPDKLRYQYKPVAENPPVAEDQLHLLPKTEWFTLYSCKVRVYRAANLRCPPAS